MTRTFEEMCAERDPLYAAMQPVGNFAEALRCEKWAERYRSRVAHDYLADAQLFARDAALLKLTICALRN